jgi:hypothetical protein
MSSKQLRNIQVSIALVLLVWLLSPLASFREPEQPIYRASLYFDASQAYQRTRDFITQNPSRVFGSLESRQASGYLHDILQNLGYQVSYSHFDARISRRKQAGRNILAYKQGWSPETLALIAHYDTARATVQGAMKNGACVGVLLELARIFSTNPTKRSLLLILSDGEEWGMLGAVDLAANYPERNQIAAVLSLDHVSIGDLASFRVEETGQLAGYSPPWLRQIVHRVAAAEGVPLKAPSLFQEQLGRSLLISWADQGPFLNAGIPAINFGSESTDRAMEKEVYHSSQDTIGNLKLASIQKYGRAAERIARTLDDLEPIPRESMVSFRLWDSRYLSGAPIQVLHVLVFLPLLLAFYYCVLSQRKSLKSIDLGREVITWAGMFVPFLVIYFLIGLVRALRLLPYFSLYPAAAKDPVLESPPWGIVGSILGVTLLIAVVCYVLIWFFFREDPKPDFHNSKLVLLGLMIPIAVFSLLHNSYWAVTFLALPALIWPISGEGRFFCGRCKAWAWIIAAGLPFYLFLWYLATHLYLGLNLLWYCILALNTGLFSAPGYFLGSAMFALGLRFLVINPKGARAVEAL